MALPSESAASPAPVRPGWNQIEQSRLLVVEGDDGRVFFQAMLQHLALPHAIQVMSFGGNRELAKYLQTLTLSPRFAMVEAVGIVRDAETNPAGAFQSAQAAIAKAGLNCPPSAGDRSSGAPAVSVFILPDATTPGMLETLCLRSVAERPALRCVEALFTCLDGQRVPRPSPMEKARAHAFLATCPKPNSQVGNAAHRGYWPLDNSCFDEVKSFLRQL